MYQYNGFQFKTQLEATWAAFFDLAGWSWQQNPVGTATWAPDFWVKFSCSHSACNGYHTLLISVLPLDSIEDFGAHPCLNHGYGHGIHADGGGAFGSSCDTTRWEIVHGAGGGVEDIYSRVDDPASLWQQACAATR